MGAPYLTALSAGRCGKNNRPHNRGDKSLIMNNELEFAYTPVREKVRDLREYL